MKAQKEVEKHELLLKWMQITAMERQAILRAYIQEKVASLVGINPSELDLQQSLKYLAIDSLIAVKLRNQLRTDLSVDVPAVKFLEDSTVASLATLVSEQIENTVTSVSLKQVHIPTLHSLSSGNSSNNIEIGKEIDPENKEHLNQQYQNQQHYKDNDWLEGEI